MQIATGDGTLTITQEGKRHKFVSAVTEITFSGQVAAVREKEVLYITERAVFALRADGLHLTEAAPGIDVQRQILDQMDFAPILDLDENGSIKRMDERIFRDSVMGLRL